MIPFAEAGTLRLPRISVGSHYTRKSVCPDFRAYLPGHIIGGSRCVPASACNTDCCVVFGLGVASHYLAVTPTLLQKHLIIYDLWCDTVIGMYNYHCHIRSVVADSELSLNSAPGDIKNTQIDGH